MAIAETVPSSPAIDCHAHVFDPARFPFVKDTPYLPPPHEVGTREHYAAVLDAHGMSHALLVNPTSGYRYDQRCMLDAIQWGKGRFRGIARLRPDTPVEEMEALHAQGVVGVRLDLIAEGVSLLEQAAIPDLFAKLRELHWVVQVQCERDQLAKVLPALIASRLTIVVDHCGRPDPALGPQQNGFQALLELGRSTQAAVKLSGAFRFSRQPYPHSDVEPFMAALLETFTPQRCVWGSDWPFLQIASRMDYGPSLTCLSRWVTDAEDRAHILWHTPAHLFGFALQSA